MKLHPASLAVGAALAIGVALLSAQQIVGSPAVEVKVIEVPDTGPEQRAFPAPPLHGSSSYTLAPGECAQLQELHLQWMGDPALVNGEHARYEVSLNGVVWTNAYATNIFMPKLEILSLGNGLHLRSGDVLMTRRIPNGGPNNDEAPNAFPATFYIDVETEQ